MCRYFAPLRPDGQRYKSLYLCLVCEIAFKGRNVRECHACKGEVVEVGPDYRAPRKGDAGWKITRRLIAEGHRFWTCGCTGPGHLPKH